MSVRAVLLGCAQDGGVPQLGCACARCEHARATPDYKDGMVVCLGIVDDAEAKVFMVDATPDFGRQLWALQHLGGRAGRNDRPLVLGGILLTHAHTGHYIGLLQLGKEAADAKRVPVYCSPSMASFLRNNEPWAQLCTRGNISIREVEPDTGGSKHAITPLTARVSFEAVSVPHRAELSDTVAFVIGLKNDVATVGNVDSSASNQASQGVSATEREGDGAHRWHTTDGCGDRGQQDGLRLLYCPDADTWSGWQKGINEWCDEVDAALLDATFYDRGELKGRDMRGVCHPLAQDTMRELAGCKAEVVLIHLNHTNPLLTAHSPQRAQATRDGFTVGSFGMQWEA